MLSKAYSQIKRKSDELVTNENDEKLDLNNDEDDLNNKKTKIDDQNDRKIVSMHAKYSKFFKILKTYFKMLILINHYKLFINI